MLSFFQRDKKIKQTPPSENASFFKGTLVQTTEVSSRGPIRGKAEGQGGRRRPCDHERRGRLRVEETLLNLL